MTSHKNSLFKIPWKSVVYAEHPVNQLMGGNLHLFCLSNTKTPYEALVSKIL